MKTIRVFLVSVILATITLFNFVAALQGYLSSMEKAEQLLDQQLLETAKLIASIHADSKSVTIDHPETMAFQIWKPGRLQAASPNVPKTQISELVPGYNYTNFGGYRWRTVVYQNPLSQNWILVAERADLRYALAENVILESIFPILLALPVVGILIWLIVNHGLKPLRLLADELTRKQSTDLSPVSLPAPKRELEQIVESTNLLFARLESSLQREKQFASDAAHELRTPISVLKVELYNLARQHPDDDETIQQLRTTIDRLGYMVEQILDLYRSSPDQYIANMTAVDLHELVQSVIASTYQQFEEKSQHLEYHGEPCSISGDSFALTTMLQNLLSNASKYTPENGNIRVTVTDDEHAILLTVEDSGPGIPPEHHQSVFKRFYRVGGDRHNSGVVGCGLGLAIVRRIVELHHADISIKPSVFETGAAFQVSFPKNLITKSKSTS